MPSGGNSIGRFVLNSVKKFDKDTQVFNQTGSVYCIAHPDLHSGYKLFHHVQC